MDDFVIARNPQQDSTLPFLVRLPLASGAVVLKVRDTWPRTAKVYCHPASEWPSEPDVVERVAVQSCTRRGAAIDLVLDRGRENRSQFVFAQARGREVIFWQSARTNKQARPNITLPSPRAWPRRRCGSPRCRSCSARRVRSPRSGRTASSARRSSTT